MSPLYLYRIYARTKIVGKIAGGAFSAAAVRCLVLVYVFCSFRFGHGRGCCCRGFSRTQTAPDPCLHIHMHPSLFCSLFSVSLGFLVSRLSSIFFFFVFFPFSFEFPVSPESPVSAFSFIYDDDCVCMLLVAVIQR